MSMLTSRPVVLAVLGVAALLPRAVAAQADDVLRWNRVAMEAYAAAGIEPQTKFGEVAIVHLAIHDALNATNRRFAPYRFAGPVNPAASANAAITAAAVLSRFFETDFVSFSMTSGAPYEGITRRFWSFSQAARENGASRVLAGIHFASAVKAGYEQGDQIGAWAFEHLLRPSPERQPPPSPR